MNLDTAITTRRSAFVDGGIDPAKVFRLLVVFELIALVVAVWGGLMGNVAFWSIILVPLFILLVPYEPVIGFTLMVVVSGFALYTQIGKQNFIFTFTYFHVVMVVTFFSALIHSFLRERTRIPSISLWPPFIAFLVIQAISLSYTPLFLDGLLDFVRLAVLGLLSLVAIISVDRFWKMNMVVWSFILVPLVISIWTIQQIVTKGEFYQAQIVNVATELGLPVYRATGSFQNPNELAMFIMLGMIIGFALLFSKEVSYVMKAFLVIVVVTISVALIATFSRGAWVAVFFASFMTVILYRRWSYFFFLVALGTLVIGFLLIKYPRLVVSSLGRLLTILNFSGEASASSRLSLMKAGIWMWEDHPLLGVGANAFQYYALDYLDPNMPRGLTWVVSPHCLQIKILAEQGIIGLAIATWFFMTVMVDGIRSLGTMASEYLRSVQIGFISLFFGLVVLFAFNASMHDNMFWISVGILYAIPLVDRNMQFSKTPLEAGRSVSS